MFDLFGMIREKGVKMISKELLESVLGFTSGNVFIKEIETKNNDIEYLCNVGGWTLINIYELAHKCKEWAYNNKYVLDCFSKCIEIRKQNEEDIIYIERGELFDNSSHDISLVFKACQWILDNKED